MNALLLLGIGITTMPFYLTYLINKETNENTGE